MGGQQIRPPLTPIDRAGVMRAKVPYFIQVEPAAFVAAGAVVTVTYTMGPRDFWWTHLGWTTDGVAFPGGGGMDFRLNIQDVGLSQFFAPFRFLIRAVTGNNPHTSDNAAFELPAPWKFYAQTSIIVEFENIGAMNCTPTVVFAGYLE